MPRIILSILSVSLCLSNCDASEKHQFITAPIYDDHSSTVDPKERLEAYNLSNYYLEQFWACECLPPVGCSTCIVNSILAEIKYVLDANGYCGRTTEAIYIQTKNTAMTVDDAFVSD